jgi:Pyruvate/2-oxoacid:ferredoxin oxidoreductase delta subunit
VGVRYHIHAEHAMPRVRPVGKLGVVDWKEDCSSCHNCVKRSCVYGFYGDESDRLRNENGYLDYIYQCKGCLTCIQNCTKNILTRVVNPEFKRLGNDYFTGDMLLSTWYQAETGGIPVSGAGYGGPFSGPGFDAMWTDMSEIVRPTRDGIHGREYINTSVDIGRKLHNLEFDNGVLVGSPPPLVETPVPVVFDVLPEQFNRGPIVQWLVQAARQIGFFALVHDKDCEKLSADDMANVVPVLDAKNPIASPVFDAARWIVVPDGPDAMKAQASLKRDVPDRIVCVRVPVDSEVVDRTRRLAGEGVEVLNIVFDSEGRELVSPKPRHMRDVIREVHEGLTKDGVRDELTVMSSGGVVMAEHVAKAVLCGVDLVAIDLPLMAAIECRQCNECARDEQCPIAVEESEPEYAVQRIVNLMGAWHNQLLELMGAMGIREARRLRGETGRCMFFDDLERATFGKLFGKRKSNDGAAAV